MKRLFCIVLTCALLFTACGKINYAPDNGRLTVMTTIFPVYDLTRRIAGAAAEVSMLLPPGVESHAFDPTPTDILKIKDSDLFIFIGGESDEWARRLVKAAGIEGALTLIDKADTVTEEEPGEGAEDEHHGHEHGEPELDEHIWTSPKNAVLMSRAILNELCERDGENAAEYIKNAEALIGELDALDAEFRAIAEAAEVKTMVFGDRFPFRYFTEEYGIDYYAAFAGCSAQTEPSFKSLVFLIDKVRSEMLNAVYYIEFSAQKVARAISEETGAEMLMFHSCHNVTREELDSGESYVSLMKKNAETLKKGLGVER